MKILHYSLGFPPYRTGGLTKFCMDLMRQQVKEGHEVSLLWPGEIKLFNKRTKIRKHNPIEGIRNYEIINPTPVPFDEGIKEFDAFMHPGDARAYELLLKHVRPNVIHVHTLMGIHKSFLDVAERQGIRLVFTAHDFFPICPKVTMFRHGKICGCVDTCNDCGICNSTALSIRKMMILQSPLYRELKDCAIVKKMRKQHRDEYLGEHVDLSEISVGTTDQYLQLRNYNYSLLKKMNIIHYNSSVTEYVYRHFFGFNNEIVVPISHSDISDHRKQRKYGECLRIRFMGPRAQGKGFDILNKAVEKLWNEGRKITLDVHFAVDNKPAYMNCHERFTTGELQDIFNDTYVLACPSIWYETFGYTVLEALSYGVPVIVSDTVGAKDIIVDGAGIVIESINTEKLYDVLRNLYPASLERMNKAIVDNQSIMTISEMTHEIENRVYMQ